MTLFRILVFCLAAFPLPAGCTGGGSYSLPPADTIPADPMPVFFSGNIHRPHKVIGIITVKAGSFKREESALYKLKKQARSLGGDAILDFQQGGPEVFEDRKNNPPTSSPYHLFSAKVIVFQD